MVRYRTRSSMSPRAFGFLFAAIGAFCLVCMIGVIILFNVIDSKIPDDAEWFDAEVSEVLSIRTDTEWKEDSNGHSYEEEVYDCKFILEYEVNGQTYYCEHSIDDRSKPIKVGEDYYVKIRAEEPEKIYKVSNTKSNVGLYIGAGVFGIVGTVFVIVGLSIAIASGKKKTMVNNLNNINNTQMNSINTGNVDNSYNANMTYNSDQVNTSQGYNNTGYNSQECNNYDYYNSKQTTDYSGTSLKE